MFDEIIIKITLKKELNRETYSNLSYKIKTDARIISHLIKSDYSLISIVPSNIDITDYISENYDLIHYLTPEQLNNCIGKLEISKINLTKELFDKLDYNNQMLVFKFFPNKCLEYFDNERRQEAIAGIVLAKQASSEKNFLNNSYNNKYYYCNHFSDDELKKLILNLPSDEFYNLFYKYNIQKYIIDMFLSMDDVNLNYKYDLLKIIYEKLPEILKNKVDLKEAGDNLEKIVLLPENLQVAYFLQNINKLNYANHKIIEQCLTKFNTLTADILLKYNMVNNDSLVCRLSDIEQEKLFSRNFLRVYYSTLDYDSNLDLDTIMYNKLSQISDTEKRNKILELYNSLEETEVVANEPFIYYNQKHQISRLLYDSNIVNNNSVELLTKYKDTYDRKILIEILTNAYGTHVLEIFSDRPNLDLLNIDNFKIFDKKIYEKLGKSFIHHVLNCEMYILDDLIGKITEDEKVLNNFVDYFKCMINDLKNLDLNTITNIMEKFIVCEDVIKQIDFNNINEITRTNLQLLIKDDTMLSIGVDSISDLNNYTMIRKKRFIEIGNEIEYVSEMKDLILAYVFGRSVSNDRLLEKLSFDKALSVFNIENLINNKEIINKMGLSKDEVSMLLLIHEIDRINDLSVLKNIYISLINRDLDSVLFTNTFDKIKNYYIEDIKNGLLSGSSLEAMAQNNLEGIDVIQFNGEEFTAICSTIGLNLSETNSREDKKSGTALLNDWLTRENGINTISTALVSSDTDIYPVDKSLWEYISDSIIFVFDNNIDIIGVGAADISSEHRKRSQNHTFEFIGVSGRDTAFSTMNELKARINSNKRKNNDAKFDSEIAIARREEDVRKQEGGLKRTMPIAMYVIGEITPKHLETAKVFNEYYEKNGLGKFRIIQVNPMFYKGEGRISLSEFNEKGDMNSGRSIR